MVVKLVMGLSHSHIMSRSLHWWMVLRVSFTLVNTLIRPAYNCVRTDRWACSQSFQRLNTNSRFPYYHTTTPHSSHVTPHTALSLVLLSHDSPCLTSSLVWIYSLCPPLLSAALTPGAGWRFLNERVYVVTVLTLAIHFEPQITA